MRIKVWETDSHGYTCEVCRKHFPEGANTIVFLEERRFSPVERENLLALDLRVAVCCNTTTCYNEAILMNTKEMLTDAP